MRKLIAPLLLGMVAMGVAPATPAYASHTVYDCRFDTVAQEELTGGQDTFTGVVYGYVVSTTPGDRVEIVCWVRVDGTRGAEVRDGENLQADTVAEQVTYTASDTQDVDLCADVYVGGALHATTCFETTTTQIPLQEVIDAIDSLFDLIGETEPLDWIFCDWIRGLDLPDQINPFYPIAGIWVDPDDCDVWLIRDTIVFVCPVKFIDFREYGDPYNGPATSC